MSPGPAHKEEGEDDESAEENGQQREGDGGQVFLDHLRGQTVAFVDDEAQRPPCIHSTDLEHGERKREGKSELLWNTG